VASVELALDDVRLFRSKILLLLRAETSRVITGVQECLDNCFADGEARSEKLKLLQDMCSLSGQFPETYWLTDVTKGNLISRGGEATVYKGGQNDRPVVVRQLHTISLGEEEEPANKQLTKVFIREVIAHWQLRHGNVVALIGLRSLRGKPCPRWFCNMSRIHRQEPI